MGLCPLVGGQSISVLVLVRAIVCYLLLISDADESTSTYGSCFANDG